MDVGSNQRKVKLLDMKHTHVCATIHTAVQAHRGYRTHAHAHTYRPIYQEEASRLLIADVLAASNSLEDLHVTSTLRLLRLTYLKWQH